MNPARAEKFGVMVRAMEATAISGRVAKALRVSEPDALHMLTHEREWVAAALDRLPKRWAQSVRQTYAEEYRGRGRKAANLAVLETLESVEGFRFGVASGEHDLREFAKARADECFRLAWLFATQKKTPEQALEAMEAVALRYGIEPPCGRNVTQTGRRGRLLDALWWRRRVRKVAGRNVEGAAVKVGLVHRRAGLYVSNETLARRLGQKRRNRALLENLTATNDKGDSYTVQALSDLGVSNPEIRRMELMTRLSGFDKIAQNLQHAAEFYTLTAPSKFHARHHITGKVNPNYQGATPKEAQAYLCKVWARIRAALHRRGVSLYGFRVAEPHHDGCPHWHMVVFFDGAWPGESKRSAVARVRAIFRRYALAEDGGETGAKHRWVNGRRVAGARFEARAIDRSRGNAAGYLAKYIAKNIDGFRVGEDYESEGSLFNGEKADAESSAKRVDAWAACWGIRQFQQIGGQSVTVWRELRRLASQGAEIADPVLLAIIAAANEGDWAGYTNLMGGASAQRSRAVRFAKPTTRHEYRTQGGVRHVVNTVLSRRRLGDGFSFALHREVKPHYVTGEETGELNKYGELAAAAIKGVVCMEQEYLTHERVWVFERSGAAASPWSPVNNCTRVEASTKAVLQAAWRVSPWKTNYQPGAAVGGSPGG